ncbi:beta-ketoacyl synthase N-terminal-like domain-containing protein, partial [Bacillus subtilis]
QTETYTPIRQKTAVPAAKPANISLQPLEHHQPVQEEAEETIQYAAAEISASRQYTVAIETLHENLRESIADVLYMEPYEVDIDEAFIDIGMDSITGLEWIKAVNKQYGTSFTVTRVYDYPTIRDFAEMLKSELGTHHDREVEHTVPIEAAQQKPAAPSHPKPAERPLQPVQHPIKKEHVKKTVPVHQDRPEDAIAIVGISGRYPGARNVREYWDNLVHARNAIRDIPTSRWDVDKYYDPVLNKKGKVYCKSMGMLDDIEHFDPLFFNIPPSEAELMDPQHRIFLQ